MKKISLGKLNIVYTEKQDGNIRLKENLEKVLKKFGFDKVYIPNQNHTNNIVDIFNLNKEADGIYTSEKNIPLGVLTADCMPIVISDGDILVVLHAGWKGLFNGIIEEGVSKIKYPQRAFSFIGASARDCCYEVGKDFLENAEKAGIPLDKRYFKFERDKIKFSMQEVAKEKLKSSSINHIVDISLCTICRENLFSYRKGDFQERILTFAWLSEV